MPAARSLSLLPFCSIPSSFEVELMPKNSLRILSSHSPYFFFFFPLKWSTNTRIANHGSDSCGCCCCLALSFPTLPTTDLAPFSVAAAAAAPSSTTRLTRRDIKIVFLKMNSLVVWHRAFVRVHRWPQQSKQGIDHWFSWTIILYKQLFLSFFWIVYIRCHRHVAA